MATYATLFLLALLTLVVLVYLPKVRKPALWVTLSLLGLGGLGVGGVWLYERHQEREYERKRNVELSLLVDHAIGKPPNCKAKPFTARYDSLLGDPLKRAEKRATKKLPETDYDRAIAAGGKPVPVPTPPPGFIPDPPTGGGLTYEQLVARGAKPVQPAREGKAGKSSSEIAPDVPFDPDDFLCELAVDDLAKFIKDHGDELNDFIARRPDDGRVAAVQTALEANGIEFHKTCKDLRDEKLDAYELHKAGCQ